MAQPHMACEVINFAQKLSTFSEHWSPRVVAEMNDYQFKLVKLEGEFVWHDHAYQEGRDKPRRAATQEPGGATREETENG